MLKISTDGHIERCLRGEMEWDHISTFWFQRCFDTSIILRALRENTGAGSKPPASTAEKEVPDDEQ